MGNTLQDLDRVIWVHLLEIAPLNEPENIDQNLRQSTGQRRVHRHRNDLSTRWLIERGHITTCH